MISNNLTYITLEGRSTDKIIQLLINYKIKLINISYDDNIVIGYIKNDELKRLQILCHKANIKLNVISQTGIKRLLNLIKDNIYRLFFLLMIGIIYFSLNKLLLNININGNHYYTDQYIMSQLNLYNVNLFDKIESINLHSLADNLTKTNNNIGWVDASLSGNNLIINMLEEFKSENNQNNNNTLIDFNNKDNLINKKIEISVPLLNHVAIIPNKCRFGFSIQGKTDIFYYKPYNLPEEYDIINKTMGIRYQNTYIFPYKLVVSKYYKPQYINYDISREEANALLNNRLKYTEDILSNEYQIVSRDINYNISNGNVHLIVDYLLKTNK